MTIDAHSLAICAMATGMVATAGCLRIDDDHCIFTGGDERCSSLACVAVLEGHTLHSSDPVGCVDLEAEEPGAYVHVKYGLLLAVTNDEGVASSVSHPRTVEDVVRAKTGVGLAQCTFAEDSIRNAVKGTAAIWRRLEHLGLRQANAYLTAKEVRAIEALDEVIADVVQRCANVSSTSSGISDATASSDTSTTEGAQTTVDDECQTSADCSAPTFPICVDGECTGCNEAGDAAACALEHPDTPACMVVGADTGACVQCTSDDPFACTGATPVCDISTHACVPCTAHEQCGEAACNLFTGACLPDEAPEDVVHVGGAAPDFDDLTTAVAQTGNEVTIIVHTSPMTYDESVTIDGGRLVALLGKEAGSGNTPPRWVRSSGDAPQLTVGSDTTVLMDGLEIIGNASSAVPGLLVDGGRAWIDRSRITYNYGGGIVAQANAELVVRNGFVGGVVDVVGLEVIDSSASVLYSTIATSTFGSTPALGCTIAVGVEVRNSIIISQGGASPDEISCPEAMLSYSATEQDIGSFDIGWFVGFNSGDFHLTPAGAAVFADIALWTTGDPPTDIDGAPRPTTNDTPDFVGADIP